MAFTKEIYYNAGIRIRDLREQNHYTREKLSEMADISPKFLYEIESGQKGFSADTLYRLAQALGTNADYILYGKYEKSTSEEMLRLINLFDEYEKASVVEILEIMHKMVK